MHPDDRAAIEESRARLIGSLEGANDITFIRGLGNIGDELIFAGTRQLLSHVTYRETSILDLRTARGDTALLTGGGAWCRHFHYMPHYLPLVESRFRRVIVLPSSFDVEADGVREALRQTRALVFARERESYWQIRDLCQADLAHDCAFFFDYAPYHRSGEGLLDVFRTDQESAFSARPSNNNDISLTCESLDEWLWTIARHAEVRTDRAHVMIAAALLGKRVAYRPSGYHKIPAIAAYALGNLPVWRMTDETPTEANDASGTRASSDETLTYTALLAERAEKERALRLLDDVYRSKVWKVARTYWAIRGKIRRLGRSREDVAIAVSVPAAQEPLRITGIEASHGPGGHRVSAEVDGAILWFESPDVELRPAPEAFGSAMLIPALHSGRELSIDGECDPVWLANLRPLMGILREWWGYPELVPATRVGIGGMAAASGAALCFSGGVDSFFSLLRSGHHIDLLVTAYGFDVLPGDETRFKAVESTLREVATEVGARPVVIRTNLRELPATNVVSWERSHGGALAALGHLLAGHAGRLLVSASSEYEYPYPWGSHWRTDPLWSASDLEVVHIGAERQREEKLWAIAHEPLVRRHLRVCWENRTPQGNCSRCEKCVRTRLILASCGELANYAGFDDESSLVRDLDELPAIHRRLQFFQRMLDRGGFDRPVERAIRRLLKRRRQTPDDRAKVASGAVRRVSSQ